MNLTQVQIKEIISNCLSDKDGLNKLVTLIMEIIMEGKRTIYPDEHRDYGNGFRSHKILYEGNMLELRVPRTRVRGFIPVLLGILKNRRWLLNVLGECRFNCVPFTRNGSCKAK